MDGGALILLGTCMVRRVPVGYPSHSYWGQAFNPVEHSGNYMYHEV
jgi:hypothetical protein